MIDDSVVRAVAHNLGLPEKKVRKTLQLLDRGNTPLYIAQFLPDQTGNLREGTVRRIVEVTQELRELADSKKRLLEELEAGGELDHALRQKVVQCQSKEALDDFIRPSGVEPGTKGTEARAKGLGSLSMMLLMQRNRMHDLESLAAKLVDPDKGLPDTASVMNGALEIIAEQIEQDSDIRREIRESLANRGRIVARVEPGKEESGKKFKQYFDYAEPVQDIPSHRLLAIRRGESESVLNVSLQCNCGRARNLLRERHIHTSEPGLVELLERAVDKALEEHLLPELTAKSLAQVYRSAEEQAVNVFAKNLRKILLAPPGFKLRVLGIYPGFRSGCKLAALDGNGMYLEGGTLYLGNSEKKKTTAIRKILMLVQRQNIDIVCIGQGPGSREVDAFVREALAQTTNRQVSRVFINDTGVNLYAASELAREELPGLDVQMRGAVSIARRFQDPLRELIKIDPKSVGTGQYLQEVDPARLDQRLKQVVQSCINWVGVELNQSPPSLLQQVAGLPPSACEAIIQHRNERGDFTFVTQLLDVTGITQEIFEQIAGFVRLHDGRHPLDKTGIHPRHYSLLEQVATDAGTGVAQLLEDLELQRKVDWKRYESRQHGRHILRHIRDELKSQGKDPRKPFTPPDESEPQLALESLKEGMILHGTVTNVTNFGAFVDLGIHQDGLVHVSQLSGKYVKDPNRVVSVGQRVLVKIIRLDPDSNRISLSIKQAKGKQPTALTADPEPQETGPEGSAATSQPESQAVPASLKDAVPAEKPEEVEVAPAPSGLPEEKPAEESDESQENAEASALEKSEDVPGESPSEESADGQTKEEVPGTEESASPPGPAVLPVLGTPAQEN